MKILFISSWFPNKIEPTNGNFVQRHAEAVALLHDVEILHAIGDFNQKELFVFDDKNINGIRTLIVYYRNTKNPLLNFLRRMKAYKLGFSRLSKPDLVHANVMHNNMLFAVYLKRKFKIPFVITEHWSALQEINHNKLSAVSKKIVKVVGNNASQVMPVSNNLLESLVKLGINTPMSVVGNVVDTNLFCPKERNLKNEKIVFLHISNLIKLKNPDKIIEVAVKLYSVNPKFELHIGGDGDEMMLIDLIKNKKAESYIKTFGLISPNEVSEKMNNSDCFILFSDNETQGCVALESLACGKPVIATNVGGLSEIIKPGLGILIEKRNEKELLSTMNSFIENNFDFEDASKMREFVVNNFSREKIGEQFSTVYQKVIAS